MEKKFTVPVNKRNEFYFPTHTLLVFAVICGQLVDVSRDFLIFFSFLLLKVYSLEFYTFCGIDLLLRDGKNLIFDDYFYFIRIWIKLLCTIYPVCIKLNISSSWLLYSNSNEEIRKKKLLLKILFFFRSWWLIFLSTY